MYTQIEHIYEVVVEQLHADDDDDDVGIEKLIMVTRNCLIKF